MPDNNTDEIQRIDPTKVAIWIIAIGVIALTIYLVVGPMLADREAREYSETFDEISSLLDEGE